MREKQFKYTSVSDVCSVNSDIKYDWFDYCMLNGEAMDIYAIEKQNIVVGYASLYNHDITNESVCLYGKYSERLY